MGHQTHVALDVPHEIVTTRLLDAPPALVWRAFTEAGRVERWWGPQGFSTTTHEMDVRSGGLWRHTMHGPDGRDYPNRIDYVVVRAPERLEWRHGDDSGQPPLFHCIVTLQALGGDRTALTLRHLFASQALRDANIATYGSVQGALDTIDRLASHLVGLAGPQDFILVRELAAAQALVWRSWTDAALLRQWWGPAIFTNTHCLVQPQVGGGWEVTMSGPFPGPEVSHYVVEGRVVEILPDERLAIAMDCRRHPGWWHDKVRPGRAATDTNPAGTVLMTVTLEPLDAVRTRQTVRQRMVSEEVLAAMLNLGMPQGWDESLRRQQVLLESPTGLSGVAL